MMAGPSLYITYMENGEKIKHGPYWTISPIGQDWLAYCVQTAELRFERIIMPTGYHTITSGYA